MGARMKGQMQMYINILILHSWCITDIYKAKRDIKLIHVINSEKIHLKTDLKIHVKEDIVNICYEFDVMHWSGRNIHTTKNWRKAIIS